MIIIKLVLYRLETNYKNRRLDNQLEGENRIMKIGIVGNGFVGSSVAFGFSPQTVCDA